MLATIIEPPARPAARDLAPPIPLSRAVPPILAVGAFLKSTVCVTRGSEAFVSAPVGDLDTPEARASFEQAITDLLIALEVEPEVVAHDLHPDFPSTHHALGLDLPAVAVQHHHAHIAALAAEHQIDGPLIGLALDGFGLGPSRESWGGELFWVDGAAYRRLGHLAPLAQPGGDVAARQPWRMAAAALHRMGRGDEIAARFADQPGAAQIAQMLRLDVNSPPTTSCGRLFDAACGLLGVCPRAAFEGEAPMRLERLVTRPEIVPDGWRINDGVLDLLPLLERLLETDAVTGANRFHGTLIAALADLAVQAAAETGEHIVALGGGCLLNHVLSDGLCRALRERGLEPLVARRVSPGDAGLSLGQAWVAAHHQGPSSCA